MNPFFSIILPTHNRAGFIKKAIESVVNQKFQSWELIIVDDGSTDNTKEVVTSFHDSRIIYYYQNNSERSVARNNGISRAKGKYSCFLDSDDYYLNDHLENIYHSAELAEFPKALFMVDVIREENGMLKNVEHEQLENHINNICYILCSKETVIPARVAVHSEILKEYRFNPILNVSEDAELFVRIATKYPFIQVPSNSVVYHLHNHNTTN